MHQENLLRRLGLFSSFIVCIGGVIGSGVFLVATDIARAVPSPIMSMLVWAVAGVISLAGALIFAELGAMFPKAGGQYVFLREAFHPVVAFLFGWTLVFVIQTGSIAAVAVAFAKFSSSFYVFSEFETNLAASFLIVILTLFNSFGIEKGSWFLDAITSFKIVAIVFFVIAAFFTFGAEPKDVPSLFAGLNDTTVTVSAFGVAMVAAFWAFDGWYALTFVAGEVRDPGKNIPRATLLGIVFVTLLYMLVNLSYFQVLDINSVQASDFVAADAARVMGGEYAVKLISILVIISVIGCLSAMIISGARVAYAMGKDRVLPPILAYVSPKNHSPNVALCLQMVWSIVLVWSGRFDQLFTYVVFAAFIFYGLTAYAVIHLRRKKDLSVERPYKVPFYPWLPLAYITFCVAFTLNSIIEKPLEAVAGLLIVGIGLPAYFYFKKTQA